MATRKTLQDADIYWMQRALSLAEQAASAQEVPVGAVLVAPDGSGELRLLGEGSNAPISNSDPTAHAEIVALRAAATEQNNYRLPGSTLYVTIEPCTMCFGAMIHARVSRLVYAAPEPKAGVISSNLNLHHSDIYNHRIDITAGVLESQAQALMQDFFKRRRKQKSLNPDGV